MYFPCIDTSYVLHKTYMLVHFFHIVAVGWHQGDRSRLFL